MAKHVLAIGGRMTILAGLLQAIWVKREPCWAVPDGAANVCLADMCLADVRNAAVQG